MKWKEWERKWQLAWEEAKVFEADPQQNKPKFFITVPYPYTSGALHIGHGRTYTTGDVIARFMRHLGYNVLFPMAFHISGAPIVSISERIKQGDEKTVKLYKHYIEIYEKDPKRAEEIIKSFVDPKNVANYFASKIIQDFKSIGFSIDWRRRFNTGEAIYNKFVEWQFKKLREKGLLVRGKHPVLFAGNQPVGEDDIKDGDVDPVKILEFCLIKFKIGDAFLVAATLRPETIFGATNVWVNPSINYVLAEVDGEKWIISKEAAEKLKMQAHNVKILEEIPAKELLGKKVIDPLGRELPVLPASFVDPDNASGVVYSVPAHAPYDYRALEDLKKDPVFGEIARKIKPIVIIDIPGYKIPAKEVCEKLGIKSQLDKKLEEATQIVYKAEFYHGKMNENCMEFAGLSVKEAKEKVKAWLKCPIMYETSRKAVTRAGEKVIVAIVEDQWFLDYRSKELKEKAHAWVDKMLIIPEKYRKWFHDTIDWLALRPCARKRGLGTKLPFDREWVIEPLSDSTIYMAFYTIAHKLRKYAPEQLTEAFFDFVFLGKGDAEEVSRETGISKEELEELRKEFLYWYPNDLRHTAPAHISNHLTFFIIHHIAIFPQEHWPKGISLNELVIREGVKMSKSKGNIIPLADVATIYGSDLYRLYVISSADLDSVVDWREKDVAALKNKLSRFVELMELAEKAEAKSLEKLSRAEKWFLTKFYRALQKHTELMKNFRFREALVEIFFKMLNNVSWLEKRVSDIGPVLRLIAEDWLIALAPVIPHTAEEFWHRLGNDSFASLAPWPEVKEELIFEEAEAEEEYLQSLLENIREVRKFFKGEPEKVYIYTAEPWKYDLLKLVLEKRQEAIKLVEPEKREIAAKLVKARVWEVVSKIIDEEKVLKEEKAWLGKELKLGIEINSSHDPLNKRAKAMPLKPGIYFE